MVYDCMDIISKGNNMLERFKKNNKNIVIRIVVLIALLLSFLVITCVRLIEFQLVDTGDYSEVSCYQEYFL